MADPLSIVTGAIKTLQKLREISQKMKNAEIRNLAADLSLNLADLKLQIAELQEENAGLRVQLKKNSQSASYRDKLTVKNGLYFFKESQSNRPDGPYCTRCFDVDEKLVLVSEMSRAFHGIVKYECPNCKAHFA